MIRVASSFQRGFGLLSIMERQGSESSACQYASGARNAAMCLGGLHHSVERVLGTGELPLQYLIDIMLNGIVDTGS